MLGPSTAIWLRKMIVPHMPGGRAPLESGLGAEPSYAGVTIAILGDYLYDPTKVLKYRYRKCDLGGALG
eukprot:COSAG05_NODE_444_length_9777_cov_20.852965_5_plen_69_part_00